MRCEGYRDGEGRVNRKCAYNPVKVCKFMSLSSQQGRSSFAVRWVAVGLAAAVGAIGRPAAGADPWLAPGDAALRHDIQWLADEGTLAAPTTTWPFAREELARAVRAVDDRQAAALPAGLSEALERVRRAAEPQSGGLETRLAGAEPAPLRGFEDSPRESGEASVASTGSAGRYAARLQVTVAADAGDGQTLRADGSYASARFGNVAVTAGLREPWWGPGWEGSLIRGTDARPIPSLTVERVLADPFETPWLRWLGPWRATASVGQGEGGATARDGRLPVRPDTKFFAARLAFKPKPWLEVGLSRTAQFCGEGRECDLGTFWDMLRGRDNTDDSLADPEQPGNQMAGYDVRLRSPWRGLPMAVYGQFIGEDEAGGLPSKFLGLMGVEAWGGGTQGSWRAHAEYTDTTCSFSRERPQVDCAYRNSVYPQGYTHRGRMIGHSMDNDSRMLSVGAIWVRASGESWSALARRVDLNRYGATPDTAHALAPSPRRVEDLQLGWQRPLGGDAGNYGRLRVGVGAFNSEAYGFVEWRRGP